MKSNQVWVATMLVAVFFWPSGTAKGDAVGNAFTYQGRLTENGSPVTDTCDFEFSLWDGAATPPAVQIGSTQTVSNVVVTDGLFTAPIDFGTGVFEGTERWQEVAVRCPAGSGSFDTLGPRQELTISPYAGFSLDTASIGGFPVGTAIPSDGQVLKWSVSEWRPGTDDDTTTPSGPAGGDLGSTYPNPSVTGLQGNPVSGTTPGVNTILKWDGTEWGVATDGLNTPLVITQTINDIPLLSITNFGSNGRAIYARGVFGIEAVSPFDNGWAVTGSGSGTNGIGVRGEANATNGIGIMGVALGANGLAGSFIGDVLVDGDVQVDGTTTSEVLTITDGLSATGVLAIVATSSSDNGRAVTATASGAYGMGIVTQALGTNGVGIIASGSGTDGRAGLFVGDVEVAGDLQVDGTITSEILTITGGSDLAEPFEIGGEIRIEAGMVVSIDAANPGQLKLASESYDRKVAGIISGANGLSPGLVMKAAGKEHADGHYPVALTGRVWCWCIASNGAIEPGDRLTTSSQCGHAMKVTDGNRADGAVIGKAMTPLEQGRGLVLVLVQPQ